MQKWQYIQRVREFVSITQSTSARDYGKIVTPQLEKLKEIALEEGFDFNSIYNEVASISKKYGMIDKVISPLRKITTNPLTEDLCEAMLEQFINKGMFASRLLETKESKNRGLNNADENTVRSAELESREVGLNIFINNIKNGNLDKVSTYYYEKIKSIGIEQLERFLKTGESTPELNAFLESVYKECYACSNDTILGDNKGRHNSLHAYKDEEKRARFRFYFNMPKSTDAVKFVRDYQIECQKYGVDYSMKPFKNMESTCKDTTIFYSSYEDLNLKLQIIEELVKKYPDIELGTPPLACAQITGLPNIGISHMGEIQNQGNCEQNMVTFNDYIDSLAYVTFINVFGMNLSSNISPELATKIKKAKSGLSIRGDFAVHGEDKMKIRTMIEKLLSDPLKRKVFIKAFKNEMQKCHNINQGYAHNLETNIALDMSYIDAVKEPEKNTQIPNFSAHRVASALKDGRTFFTRETDKIPE